MKLRLLTAVAACLVLAGCSTAAPDEGGDATGGDATKGTIKIAGVLTSSGNLADNAQTVSQTWQYAVDEINAAGGVDGYMFEYKRYDTDATAATTVRSATQAVNQDGAQIVLAQSSPEVSALNSQLLGLNAISLSSVALDDGLLGVSCSPNAFQMNSINTQMMNALSASLAEIDGDKWAILSTDYSTGHGAAESFTAAAEELGREVVSTQFAPLNTSDFGSYITQIQNSGADSLMLSIYGPDAVAFTNQASQFGLLDNLTSQISVSSFQEDSLTTLGDKILGNYLVKLYNPAYDNESNKAFVEGYTEEFGVGPNDFAGPAYIAAQALFAAVAEAQRDDVAALVEALHGMEFESIQGPITMRTEDNFALKPIYMAEVVEGDNGLQFEVVKTFSADDTAPQPNPECKL